MKKKKKNEENSVVYLAQWNRDYSIGQTPLGQHLVEMICRDVLVKEFLTPRLCFPRGKE